jgi:hypothetical protein
MVFAKNAAIFEKYGRILREKQGKNWEKDRWHQFSNTF